jgi:hypothetical protein
MGLAFSPGAWAVTCSNAGNYTANPGSITTYLSTNTTYAIPINTSVLGRDYQITSVSAYVNKGAAGSARANVAIVKMNASTLAVTTIYSPQCVISGPGSSGYAWVSCTLASPLTVRMGKNSTETLGIAINTNNASFATYSATTGGVSIAETYSTTLSQKPTTTGALMPYVVVNYSPLFLQAPTSANPDITFTSASAAIANTVGATDLSQESATACYTSSSNSNSLMFDSTLNEFRRP